MGESRIPAVKTDFVIDGLNVCRWQRLKTSLPILLTLLNELNRRSETFTCVFDAVTPHRLRKEDVEPYQELLTAFPDQFTEVTGGIEADDIILSIAQSSNCSVISNDRYRKKKYIDRHPWVETQSHRLIKGCVAKGNLIVSELSINVEINNDFEVLIQEIRQRLAEPPTVPVIDPVTTTSRIVFPTTGQRVKHRSELEDFSDDEITAVQSSPAPTNSQKRAAAPSTSDLAKRERLVKEIAKFREEDARRRRAEKRLGRSS